MKFNDTYFSIAYRLLCEPGRKWTTLDFPDCHRPYVINFLNYLVREEIMVRPVPHGRNSHALLVKPEELLALCSENFKLNEELVISLLSKRSDAELLKDLNLLQVDFYLGRFTGIRRELIHATVTGLSLLIPDRSFFYGDKLANLQLDVQVYKVKFGGNINLILPRYKEFLKKHVIIQDNMKLPHDFYTYLYLSSTNNVMALPQKEYMEKQLGGINGNFLAWK